MDELEMLLQDHRLVDSSINILDFHDLKGLSLISKSASSFLRSIDWRDGP